MSVIDSTQLLAAGDEGGYQIANSVRMRSSASAYVERTYSAAGNQSVWTWSAWIKRGSLTSFQWLFGAGTLSAGGSATGISVGGSGGNEFNLWWNSSASSTDTAAQYRDPAAWYHLTLVANTTTLTLYVNGTQVAQRSISGTAQVNNTVIHRMGCRPDASGIYFDGYMAEVNFINGQALTPSSFGETDLTTGVWKPKAYTGTYGTTGFYLKFSDTSAFGKDSSGNTNTWTATNISNTAGATYDSMTDVPTLGPTSSNYCTLNPIYSNTFTGNVSDGNLAVNTPTTDGFCPGTFGVSSGKWYFEASMTNAPAAGFILGIVSVTAQQNELRNVGTGLAYSYLSTNGNKSNGSGGAGTAYGATFTTGNVIGVAFDLDGGSITFYKDGVSQGVAYTGISGTFLPVVGDAAGASGGQTAWVNFGQRPFSQTPPTGYKALNTQNLPDPTIKKGSTSFDVQTWTGDGVNGRTITSTVDTVDLAWVKKRSAADDHRIANSVTGGNKHLKSNTTDAEATGTTIIQAFSTNTFTIGSDGSVNGSGGTYVGWLWKKGATPGFDIVTYTGNGANRTVAHSLGVAPSMLIFKPRNAADNWPVWHKSFAVNEYTYLNLTNAKASLSTFMNSTLPDSSNITLGTWANTNANTQTMVCYAFAEVAGFSRFGSYTGNGSADGPFVFCGFRPKFLLVKEITSGATAWLLIDAARNTYNVVNSGLFPNNANAEASATYVDFVSNGFKIRNTFSDLNGTTSQSYIYAAFAENPFKYSLAR